MRKIEINYQNTTSLVNDLITVTSELENEKESVKRALDELNDLENYHANKGEIVNELEFRKRKIDKDIENTEELIQNIKDFSERVQETDERLAQKFKQDIKSYAKQNSIELVSDFDKWLDKAQMALDAIGIFPLVGEVADVINGVIYLAKGDIKNAGISFISMIPEIGDTAKGARYLDKASDLLKLGDKVVDLEKSSKKISKATKNLDIKDIDFDILNKNTKKFDIKGKKIDIENKDFNVSNKKFDSNINPKSEYEIEINSSDVIKEKNIIRKQILDTPSAKLWGTLDDGTNQGVKHFTDYWEKYPERIPSLAKRLGVDESKFENTVEGFKNFTEEVLKVKKNGILKEINGKEIYYLEGATNPKKGVVAIFRDGKIQSMMPSDIKSFNKMK